MGDDESDNEVGHGSCSDWRSHFNGRDVEEEVEVMNTKTQTMEALTRNPTGRGMGVGVVDDRFIWTFGGFDGLKVVDVIEMCVTSKTGEWKTFECEDDICTCSFKSSCCE